MKKFTAYILLFLHLFFAGNSSMFLSHYFSIENANAASTTLSYVGTATNLALQWNPFLTPTNAQWNQTLTSAMSAFNWNAKTTDTLALTNFNLAAAGLPATATINWIRAEVEFNTDNATITNQVQLTKNGTVAVGLNRAVWVTQTAKAFRTYGGAADLWGTTWTATELRSANFWVLLNYISTAWAQYMVNVYRVRVTIDYTPAPNNPPTNILLSNNTINEWQPAGTTVGLLSTVDPDVGNTHTYSFACTVPWADSASFSIAGNNLNSNAVFNFATKSTYNICVRTNDGLGWTFDKNFVITVNQVIVPKPGWVSTWLNLWLKSNAGTSTTTNNTNLATWNDQSGNGKNANSVVAPLYRNNTTDNLNFYPVVKFNGVDQYMRNSNGWISSKNYFAVVVPTNQVDGTLSWWVPFSTECTDATVNTWVCNLAFGWLVLGSFTLAIPDEVVTHALWSSQNYRSSQTWNFSYEAKKPMLVTVNENAAWDISEVFEKWVQINNFSTGNKIFATNTNYSLWASLEPAFPFYYDGDVVEIINYNERLSNTDKAKIESYLSLKYGVTLNNWNQNYIASDGTTLMWSTATAGSFNSNVFGIGRDNLQALTNVKSKSVNKDSVITLEAVGEWSNTAPSFVDMTDKEFFTISNNNLWNYWSSTWSPSGFDTLTRVWKAQEVWDVGTVTLEFDVANPNFDIPNLNAGTVYNFVYDSNNNGSLTDETPSVMTNTSGNLWKTNAINMSNGQIFTIATQKWANNIPTNITLSNNTVNENIAANSTIWTLTTTDADAANTHTYSLVPGLWDTDNQYFTTNTNVLRIIHSPDFEIKNTYSIRIQTNDWNAWVYQKTFTITINDVWEWITSIINFEQAEQSYKYSVTSWSWIRNNGNVNEGLFSFESDIVWIDATQACFEIEHTDTGTWTVSFDYNTSSEVDADFLRYYVDNVEQQAWSGETPWSRYNSPEMTAWTHMYKWCYIKNVSWAAWADKVYIDNIQYSNNVADTTPPTITNFNFASGSLLPGWNHTLIINYSDNDSGIDINSTIRELYKWNGTDWWADISGTGITNGAKNTTTANYATNSLWFGKYMFVFRVSDNAWNNSAIFNSVFYVDEPIFIIWNEQIDIGNLNANIQKFSTGTTLTVRTVWAPFKLFLNRNGELTDGNTNIIQNWNGSKGYWYDVTPLSWTIKAIASNELIKTQSKNINTNGNLNTYTYNIQIWADIDEQQAAWDYLWKLDFKFQLDY